LVTLLTDYDPFGAILSRWTNSPPDRRPAGRRIEYAQGRPSGAGTGYVGSIDGVEVFTADVEEGHSYLCSAQMLEAVSYRLVTPDAFVSVEFDEGDNPWNGTVIVRFAQQVAWRDTSVIDLVVEKLPGGFAGSETGDWSRLITQRALLVTLKVTYNSDECNIFKCNQ
jgi:hypothetical protein